MLYTLSADYNDDDQRGEQQSTELRSTNMQSSNLQSCFRRATHRIHFARNHGERPYCCTNSCGSALKQLDQDYNIALPAVCSIKYHTVRNSVRWVPIMLPPQKNHFQLPSGHVHLSLAAIVQTSRSHASVCHLIIRSVVVNGGSGRGNGRITSVGVVDNGNHSYMQSTYVQLDENNLAA